MKNYSKITENKDILTKEYADSIYAKVNDIPTSTTVSNWGFTKNIGTITGIKMNGSSKGTSGVVDLGTVITAHQDISGLMPKSGGTFTGEVKFGNTENFQGYYIKRMIGSLGAGTRYADLDSSYKDGTWHRMWRLRFPSGSNFWGKIKITLYGGYSSFNASGVMSKSITCNFNTSNIYNNVGCYDGLGVNVEQDFRISEAIWNATVSAWEVLIWQKNLNGNNSPTIMLECWTTNNTNYINAFNGITAQAVELTKSTSYSAQKASPTGGTKTVEWATLPVYENPLGEEIATMSDLPNSVKSVIDYNKADERIKIGYAGASLFVDEIKYVAGYTAGDSESVARIKDIPKDKLKSWLGYATVAESGSYNDLSDKPTIPTNYVTTDTEQTISGAKTFTSDVVVNKATPKFNMKLSGLTNGTTPSANQFGEVCFLDKNGVYEGGIRFDSPTNGENRTKLSTNSFGTTHSNYVALFAKKNASSATATDIWRFIPNQDAVIDLGQSDLRWRNVRAVTTYSNVYGSDLCSTNSLRLKDPNITRGTNQAASGGKQNYYRAININDKNNHKGVAVEWGYLCEKNSNGNTTKHVSELNLLVYPPNTTDNANFVKVALGKRSDGTTYFTYAGDQVITTKNFSLSGTTLTITL